MVLFKNQIENIFAAGLTAEFQSQIVHTAMQQLYSVKIM